MLLEQVLRVHHFPFSLLRGMLIHHILSSAFARFARSLVFASDCRLETSHSRDILAMLNRSLLQDYMRRKRFFRLLYDHLLFLLKQEWRLACDRGRQYLIVSRRARDDAFNAFIALARLLLQQSVLELLWLHDGRLLEGQVGRKNVHRERIVSVVDVIGILLLVTRHILLSVRAVRLVKVHV